MSNNYVEKDLLKITDPDKALYHKEVSYWALNSDTADGVLNIDYSRMSNSSLQKIRVEYIGDIQVEP